MCHSDSARRWRGRCLALDGGLVLAAVLVHRCYLRDEGKEWDIRCGPRMLANHLFIRGVIIAPVLLNCEFRGTCSLIVSHSSHCCVYLSPVFPQITGLLGREKTIVNIHVLK